MLDNVFQEFNDSDGNFAEQFRTTGFDARCFELYVFAYLSRSGFIVRRDHEMPDFLATKDGQTVAIEVTTVGPSTSGALAKAGKQISGLSPSAMLEYIQNELPIRFGSPLFSKMQRRYWELEHCQGLPFIIMIEAFHDDEALLMSDGALTGYLYGLAHVVSWGQGKELVVDWKKVKEHKLGEKTIPSNFFGQAGTEHISAVVFTNSGTLTKFERMGYQAGVGNNVIAISRFGFCVSEGPNVMDPSWFSYSLEDPPLVESWGQGLVVIHNPAAAIPMPKDLFSEAAHSSVEDGRVVTKVRDWHPFSSRTLIEPKLAKLPSHAKRIGIIAIPQSAFVRLGGSAVADANPIIEENGWFTDETEAFLGVITRDKGDNDWGYVVLARDQCFRFRAISWSIALSSRAEAVGRLRQEFLDLLARPKRLFHETDPES